MLTIYGNHLHGRLFSEEKMNLRDEMSSLIFMKKRNKVTFRCYWKCQALFSE